ncbi:hypothetical protein JCM11957_04910 [Caminibacter profundus]
MLESKGSLLEEERRNRENYKIKCAKKHFEVLSDVEYVVAKDFDGFKEYWY